MCDPVRKKAEERRRLFYPDAAVLTDHREMLRRDDVEVVDVATHAEIRAPITQPATSAPAPETTGSAN